MEEQTVAKHPSVVPVRDIPISCANGRDGLEIRPFDAHAILSGVVPKSVVEMAWTQARAGQDVPPRAHPNRSLLVVLDGSAELTGSLEKPVVQGDVVTVPEGIAYGFRAVGAHGLHVLHVSFAKDAEEKQSRDTDLSQLLARNEERMQQALNNPFYRLLKSGELRRPNRRGVMREALRVFSDAFQNILFTRQATCRDERYAPAFHDHLQEEIGHNELLKVPARSRVTMDPILRASSVWFCHQMLVLDNAGKTVVNLVLETAGFHFHTLASTVLESDESSEYFRVHAEDDEAHMQVGLEILRSMHPENFRTLRAVMEDAWDMFETMAGRIAYLVDVEEVSA